MSVKTFAAIDVGSYELSMKIFELSPREKLKEIDHIRHRIDLGTETYTTGKLSHEKVDELCRVLCEFGDIMKSYRVTDYQAYGTSAVREMANREIVLEQIKMRTGISIEILSNSEQRFLDYKSIASRGESFHWLISNGTAIIDIGGGSIQVSLFDKDSLVTTQNMRLGILLIREQLTKLKLRHSQYEDIIEEMAGSQIEVLEKLYLKGKKIDNIIVVDEYISNALGKKDRRYLENYIDGDTYLKFMEEIRERPLAELGKTLQMPEESILLLFISSMLVLKFLHTMGAAKLWIPGVTLCDGIGYEYAEKNKILVTTHDFEKDIIDCTQNISKRYMGSKKRGETLEKIALTIFDSMKKIHGLSKRERLLLRLARSETAAICMHTNLDAARGGVNDALAAALGLEHAAPAAEGGIERVGTLPEAVTLPDFLARVKAALHPNGLRYVDGGRPVRKVAVGGGACGDFLWEAAALGCDAFVTADLKYNHFLDAQALGLTVVDAGHFPTEDVVCPALVKYLGERFPGLTIQKSSSHREAIQYDV